MKRSIEKLRVEYGNCFLLEENLLADPLDLFKKWLNEAIKAEVMEANAFTFATVSSLCHPSARTVLLKSLTKEGFVFFTNYLSRKSSQLAKNPHCAMTFWWRDLYRQVCIEGVIKKLSRIENERYFARRPKGAQIAATISKQSETLANRMVLDDAFCEMEKNYRGKKIPCPKDWGGFLVIPQRIEFWQGHKNRLHDRILFVKVEKEWTMSRLYP